MRLPLMSQSALSHSNGGLYDGMRNSTEGTSGIGHAVADKLAQVGVSMYQSWAGMRNAVKKQFAEIRTAYRL